jgi:hypothetical protein
LVARLNLFALSMALKFNERINQQDLEGLAELMTDDQHS